MTRLPTTARRTVGALTAAAVLTLLSHEPATSLATTHDVARPGEVTLRTLRALPPEHPRLALSVARPGPGGSTEYDVSYRSGGLRITGVLLRPPGRGSHPGVVLVHGVVDPETYTSGSELIPEQRALVRSGHVVLVPDLRNLAGSDGDDAGPADLDMGSTLDVVNAVHALAAAGGVACGGVALVGHSLGGLLVQNAAVVAPDVISSVVALNPSGADPWVDVTYFLTPGDGIYDQIVAAHGTPDTHPSYWRDVRPTTFVRPSTPRLLVVQATEDDVIPPSWAHDVVSAWRAAGGHAQLSSVPGDHVFDPDPTPALRRMVSFLAR